MRRLMVTCAMALTVVQAAQTLAAAEAPTIDIPTFVDPQIRYDKPDLGDRQVLRFLTSDDFPPFDFLASDGTLTGFNVDLARAICGVLKLTCSIQALTFDDLIPALNAQAGDAVIASLAITPASRAAVTFSIPTMKTPARFAARAGAAPAIVLPETIGGSTVGVQGGTAHEAFLRQAFPKAAIKLYTDPESLRAALKSGAIDLLFADGIATALWLNGTAADRCCQFAGGSFTESRFFGEGSGIAVRKGDLPLQQALDYALQRLAADGVTADLYLKYFPIGFY